MPSLEQIAKGAKASGLTQKDFEARILANPKYSNLSREEVAAAWGGGLKKKDQSSGIKSPGEKTESMESPSLSVQERAPIRATSVSDAAPSLSRQQGLSDLSKQKPASTKPRGEYDGLVRPGRTPVAVADAVIAKASEKQMTNENELGQVRAFAGRELLNEIANVTNKVTDDQAGNALVRNANKIDDLYRQFSPDDSGSMFVRDQNGNTAIDPNALNNVFKFADAEVAKGVALKLREEELGNAIGNNATSRIGLGLLELVFTLPDMIANIPGAYAMAGAPDWAKPYMEQNANQFEVRTRIGEIGKGFGDVRNELSRAEMVTDFGEDRVNLGIYGNLKEGSAEGLGVGMAMMGNAFIENLPQLAMTILAPEAAIPILGTMSATSTYNEVLDNKDYNMAEKLLYSTVMGGVEYLSEKILNADIRALRGALSEAGIDIATKQGKKELGDLMFGKIPQSFRVLIEEPLEETFVSATGEVMQAAIEGKPINAANIAEGALAGLGAAAGISVLTNGISAIGKSTDSANIIKTQAQIKKLSDLMNDPSISEEEKAVLRPKLEQLIKDDKKIRENSADYYSKFTDEDVQETVKLNQVISEGIKNYSKMTTPEAKAEVAANVKAAMEAKKAIETKYDSQEEQQVPGTQQEGEAPIQAQPVEEAGAEAAPAGGVVQEEAKPVEDITFGTAFDLQDKTAEVTVSDKDAWGKSGLIRERTENVGDILRELSSRGENPDPEYIQEKINKLKSWIPENSSIKGNSIPENIKTIDEFNDTTLKFSNVVDGFEYLMKFNSGVVEKIKSEYEAIPTYTNEQKLAKDAVLALLNNDMGGLKKNLNELQSVVDSIRKEGKLKIVKSSPDVPKQSNKAVAEEIDTKEEDSEIEFYDNKIIDLQSEIEIEKGNLKEAKAEIDQQIKDVRADKTLTPAERREKVEDLQAQKQDIIDDLTGNIEVYKEEIKAFKSDIKKLERAKAKKLEKAKAAPVAAPTIAEPVVVDKATDKEGRKPQETQKDGNDLILKHGSPYSFDKFLLEKVGTGEGAQAFGYGLYFTESTGIAESYARKLSEDKTGMLYTIRVKDGNTKNWLPWREPVTDGYFDKLKLTEQEQNEYQEYLDADRDDYKEYFGAYGDLNNGDGYFFQGSVEAENVPNYAVYLDLADAFGQEKATDILKRSGYSGIVYNSKKGYGDAKNYVVFDPASIEIIESGKPEPKTAKAQEAAPVKETKAPAGKVANSEEVASRIASSPSKARMYTAVKRAANSLKKLFPNAEYVFVDSNEEAAEYYKQNMENVPADEKGTDKGRIIQNKNNGNIEIVINTSSADATTVYHELFHAAFYKAYAQDAATAIDFANRLSKVLNSGTAAEKAIAKRVDEHVAKYDGDTEGVVSEEFLSELAGILAADAKSITQGMAAKIANFINNIAKKMGIGPVFTEAATTKEVVDFINSFAAAAREGGDVTEKAAKTGALRSASSKSVQQKADTVDSIREKVGKLPTIMTEAMSFADAASMNNKIEFKRALQEKFKKNLPELRKKYKITDGSVMDDNLKKYLVDAYTYETLVAIQSYPDALGWYDSKTRKAMEIMSLIHPELKTDPISESAFKIVLAITSNGNKVKQNFDEADRQYRYWKENGRFDSETSIGTQSAGIKSTLRLVNAVLDRISMPEFYSFLNSKFKAGDLTYLNSSGKKTNLLSGYLTKDIVFGASIFGPKIGNGFFMNLNGEFGQLTMDRWFMRQYGRLTGTLLTDEITAKKKISNNILNVKESVNALTKEERAVLNSLIPGASQKNIKDLAIAVAKVSIKSDSREKISVGNLNQLRKDANTLDKNLKGEIEAPQGGTQRKFIVDIFNEVQEKLKNEFGIDITIADLQAVNWYPEKSLYKAFKKGKDSVKSKDLTSIDEQPDYESAAVSLAKENGITQSEIDDATRRITGDGATGESIGESVKQGIGKFSGFDQAVIEDLSKKILDVKSEMTGGFDEQTEVPKKTPRKKKSKKTAIIEATPSTDGRLPVDIAVQELDDFSPRSSKLDNSKKGFSSDELMYLKDSGMSQSAIEKIINNGTYAFLTAENPDNIQASKEENAKYMEEATEWLRGKGYEFNPIYGMYNNKENSFFVPYMTFEDAALFRERFRQESVAHSDALINGKSQDRVANEMYKKDYESLDEKEKAEVDAGVAESKYCNPRIKGENSFNVDYKNPENDYYSVIKPYYSTPIGISTSYDDKKGSRFSISKGLKNSKSREEVIVDILEKGGKYGLNDDGKGNFVFYHYGNIKGPAIKGSFFGNNAYTSDKRYSRPVSMYYTRRGESESMVQTFGRKPHVVLIPKNKVYPFNVDPMGYYYEAKRRYVLHLYPSGEAYGLTVDKDLHKFDFPVDAQAAFIGEIAKENGYLMMVSTWNSMGISTRAESQTDLEYDVEATNTYRETNERRIYPDKELIDIPVDLQSRSSKSSEASDVARNIADQYYKNRGNVDQNWMQKLSGNVYSGLVRTPEQMEALRMKETRDSKTSRQALKIRRMAENLYNLIKKSSPEAAALVTEYMSGPTAENIDAIENLKNGAKILDAATEMRAFLDQMSRQLVDGPAFAALNQELKEVILGNVGSYLKTSYRFWKDKNYKITDKAIKNAAAHVYDVIRAKKMGLLIKEGKSQQEIEEFFEATKEQMFREAVQQINDYVREVEKIRSAPKFKGSGMVTAGQVKIPGESFQKRKDIPAYIQELLGVEKDPQIRFIDTALALTNILYKGEMAAKMANAFGNDFFISDDVITKEDKESGMYKQVKDEYSPLNRMWVPTDIFKVINNEDIYNSDIKAIQGYYNLLQFSRKSKVLYNLPTWRKNITGGWQIIMANGILNPQFLTDLANRPAFTLKGKETEAMTQLLDEMAQYGLIGGDVNANLINGVDAMYSGILRGDYSNVDKTISRLKNVDKKLSERYSAIDDYTKMVIYRNKRDSFAKKLYGANYDTLNESQQARVREAAAEETKQTTPTFSRLPSFYRTLAKLPLGDFLSFKLEAVRSLSMIINTASSDVKKAMDPKLSAVQRTEYARSGLAKFLGAFGAISMSYIIPSMIESALGFDEEETEDMKLLRPNWMSGDNLIVKKADSDGNVSVYDMTMEDTYGEISSMIVNLTKGEFGEVVNIFGDALKFNMVVNMITNLANKKDQYGRPLFESYDSNMTSAYKVAMYLMKETVFPPFLYSSVRDAGYQAEQTGENILMLSGENVLKRSLIRDYKYNIGQQFYFDAVGVAEGIKKDEQYTSLTGLDRENRLADIDKLKQKYEAIVRYGKMYDNNDMIKSAKSAVKKYYGKDEERYILYGQMK